MEQLKINLPISENEPKPWALRVWYHMSFTDHLYSTKESAYEALILRLSLDLDEWVEGIFGPDGEFIGRPNDW